MIKNYLILSLLFIAVAGLSIAPCAANKIDVSSTVIFPDDITVGVKTNVTGVLTDDNGKTIGGHKLAIATEYPGLFDFQYVTTNSKGQWSFELKPKNSGENYFAVESERFHPIYNFFRSEIYYIAFDRLNSTIKVPKEAKVGEENEISGKVSNIAGNGRTIYVTLTVGSETFYLHAPAGQWSLKYIPDKPGKYPVIVSSEGYPNSYHGFSNSTNLNVIN